LAVQGKKGSEPGGPEFDPVEVRVPGLVEPEEEPVSAHAEVERELDRQ
jgi:hypothetical protein